MAVLRTCLLLLSLYGVTGQGVNAAWANARELSDEELTEVYGQGLVGVTNSSLNGLDFSTITFNSDVTLNANLKNIVLGQYTNSANNGSGSDINISLMQFGTSAGTTAQRTVQISNPYIEFVYNNAGGAGNAQVIGMRFGFAGISGNVGLLMNSVSGSLQIDGGAAGLLTSNASRATNICAGTSCIPLSQIGGVVAGNASGPSRDFWLSMLSQAVQFPAQPGMAQPNLAQSGAWMNWTDRLTAQSTTGIIQANVLTQKLHH